jgi:hypothetical protein
MGDIPAATAFMARRTLDYVNRLAVIVFFTLIYAGSANGQSNWNLGQKASVNGATCDASRPPGNLVSSWTGWQGDPNSPPYVNTVYYVLVKWDELLVGSFCPWVAIQADLYLPPGTDLAISAANPVRCFYRARDGNFSQLPEGQCSQTPLIAPNGAVTIRDPTQNDPLCPRCFAHAPGTALEVQVPVASRTPFNAAIRAVVLASTPISSASVGPQVAMRVRPAGTPMFSPGWLTQMSCSTTAASIAIEVTLERAGTTGLVDAQLSSNPISGSTCPASGAAAPVTRDTLGVSNFRETWPNLSPGTRYYWRFCYQEAGGTYITKSYNEDTCNPNLPCWPRC